MAESDVLTGFGTTLFLKIGSGTLTEVGEIVSIDPGGRSFDTYKRTHFKSPGRLHEYGKSMAEPGKGKFSINWMPSNATDDLIASAVDATDPCDFKIVYPGDATNPAQQETGKVLVLSRTPAVPMDDRMTCEVDLQFSGVRTMAAAT